MSEEKKEYRKIQPGRVRPAEVVRREWACTVEQGVTREDLSSPEFWSLKAREFKPYDRLEVRADDGTFFAEYLILTCDRTWAKVQELSWHNLGTQDISLTESQEIERKSKYSVHWRGPHLLFCVERNDGGKVERLRDKLRDKSEAVKYLEEHLKTVG